MRLPLEKAAVVQAGHVQSPTVATPVHLWFGPSRQVRCEIVQESDCGHSLRTSEWALTPDGWHAEHGISVRSWSELLRLIVALLRSWVSLLFRSASARRAGGQS